MMNCVHAKGTEVPAEAVHTSGCQSAKESCNKYFDENNYKYVFKMQFKQVRKICGCKLQHLAFSFLDNNCAVPGSNNFYIYGLVDQGVGVQVLVGSRIFTSLYRPYQF
jgi:hypothetical protein